MSNDISHTIKQGFDPVPPSGQPNIQVCPTCQISTEEIKITPGHVCALFASYHVCEGGFVLICVHGEELDPVLAEASCVGSSLHNQATVTPSARFVA